MEVGTALFLNQPGVNGPMEHMGRGGHEGDFFISGLGTAVWAALIVLLVLWVVRNWSHPRNPLPGLFQRVTAALSSLRPAAASPQTPVDILQVRYAKGEITREAYETIGRDLLGEPTPGDQGQPAQA
jgi:uncharacterized membrane protein